MNRYSREDIAELFHNADGMIFLDPPEMFDKHLVGIVENHEFIFVPIYDGEAIIQMLVHEQDMSLEDARDYFDFNIEGAKFGNHTPMFMWRVNDQ